MANIAPSFGSVVNDFLQELEDDFHMPQQSRFQDHMHKFKKNIHSMEEVLSDDKNHVSKLIASMKELFRCGETHGQSLATCADDLVKFGTVTTTTEPLLGNAFVKFGTLLNQMSSLLTNMVSSSRNILLFSLNLLFENELKGNKYKSDIRSLQAQYQSARSQVERDEKKMLTQAGFNVSDKMFSAEEIAGKLVIERRKFQLGVCEYMLKVSDVKTKKGVDLAEHLVGYYKAQECYFNDSSGLLQALKSWESKLNTQINELRSKQDEERKKLTSARERLKTALGIGFKQAGPLQVDPSANTDLSEKFGYLGKRPENVMRIPRRQWPKRYCSVTTGGFSLSHSHNHAPHVKIPIMHFQFKDCPEPIDNRKYCFKLIAQARETRTYTFDAETEKELSEWRQAMQNCQLKLFQGELNEGGFTIDRRPSHSTTTDTRELVKRIIKKIQSLPGNDKCCDCGSPDPDWFSVNLGILICIHCSGRHRELSVQYSRIRSLTLDALKTSELLIALVMGNQLFNEVLEANLTDPKPTPDSTNEKRQEFISSKYLQHKYVERSIEKDELLNELYDAVDARDIKLLLQVYAEEVELCSPLPDLPSKYTALHLAIEQDDLTSLHIVDFLLGNGRTVNVAGEDGVTPLHLAVSSDSPQCVKILLNHKADITAKNAEGLTALDIAESRHYEECIELLKDAEKKKFSKCEHIDVDWGVGPEQEDIYQTPVLDSQPVLKRSGTDGNIADLPQSAPAPSPTIKKATSGLLAPDKAKRQRPHSQFIDRKPLFNFPDPPSSNPPIGNARNTHKPVQILPGGGGGGGGGGPSSLSSFGTLVSSPANPAPPPPPRTLSKMVETLNPGSPHPVPPKRSKRNSRTFENLGVVEALYDCDPDHRDELGFQEGDRIVITKKCNKDWWQGYVEGNPSVTGVFPVNYVQPANSTPLLSPPSSLAGTTIEEST